jgi:oligopeptide/dipeptide ABC transporter ATP-binding protein
MIGVLPQPDTASVTPCDRPLLEIKKLRTEIRVDQGTLVALDDVSFSVSPGKTIAIVGETGSGKSMTVYSILRLLPEPGRIASGSIRLRSKKVGEVDVAALPDGHDLLYRIRGDVVGLIFQEPLSSLSPVHSIGDQISEVVRLHRGASRKEAKRRALEMLGRVGIPNPERTYAQYPHQLSGGMRQRAVIAMALICEPELVIADEPTTALDVTTQAQVLGLLKELQRELGCALILITHDMGVVAQMADEVAVMYYGRIVERGDVRNVLRRPLHPYAQGLLRSLPSMNSGERLFCIPGSAPSLLRQPAGCPFHLRCSFALAGTCDVGARPSYRELRSGHTVACHRADEFLGG